MSEGQAPPAAEATSTSTGLTLEVVAGTATGETMAIDDELVIGRHIEGLGRLADDIELSRQHARIARGEEGRYVVEDLGSTNGTFVNGDRIEPDQPQPLALGDTIEVGGTSLLVKSLPASAAPAGQPTASREVAAPEAAKGVGLNVQLSVDFEAREARLSLEPGGSFRLVLADGRWQLEEEE